MARFLSTTIVVVLFLVPDWCAATPANKTALLKYLGPFAKPRLDSCITCHVKAEAHGAESLKDFPHNQFGKSLQTLGRKVELSERLKLVIEKDADGDGVANLDELLAGSFPGRSDSPVDQSVSSDLRTKFEEFSRRYPWRPFKPVARPAIPPVDEHARVANAIDHFIIEQQGRHGLKPGGRAPKGILLRRAYLDLLGLAPTVAERDAFLNDASPDAYQRMVNGLLERPEYGERWARHWMDIWRYSDWAGYKAAIRDSQRHIWHWRDWIVESLNADKPYDQMIREMIAADELYPADSDKLRGTGYLARQYFANRQQWMDNVVTHTSQAFLGITLGCSKCHDHMYDDLPQQDYYAMRAIFESYNVRTDRVPGELDIMKNGIPRAYDQSVTSKTYMFERGDERRPMRDQAIVPGVPAALGGTYALEPVSLPRLAYRPERRSFVVEDMMSMAERKVTSAASPVAKQAASLRLAALKAELAAERIEDAGKKSSDQWKAMAEKTLRLQREAAVAEARAEVEAGKRDQTAAQSAMKAAKSSSAKSSASRKMSSAKKKVAAAEKKLTAAEKVMKGKLSTKYKSRATRAYLATSSGRRSAFARWLSAKENPLTARVAMNHIWLRHFGQAIVPTPNELGANGREPTHPALLDWLAAEFMDRDWSMKEMHRLIVTSQTYQLAATSDVANSQQDPDNKWLWRWPSRRMEGEIVRDNLLHVAGTVDRSFGGPDIDNRKAQSSKRRSIYLRHAHEKLVEFVQIFDGPKVSECYLRDESVQPHQALALANSPLTFDQSKVLSAGLSEQAGADPDFIRLAYQTVLSRDPKADEQRLCEQFLKDTRVNARQRLVMILFNHNDFVTIR